MGKNITDGRFLSVILLFLLSVILNAVKDLLLV